MNIFLWALQILLALHTLAGAAWKFSKTAEETMPSLKAIPYGAWLGMSVLEIICALCLIVPAFYKPAAILIPLGAMMIAIEMLAFCGLHWASGDHSFGPMIYWLVIALICVVIAYGRFALLPLQAD